MPKKKQGMWIVLALALSLSIALVAPPTAGIDVCVACGSFWIPDPSGGPTKYCESCFADIGPAVGCWELFPDSDGCSDCSNIGYGLCDL
jgi:hypothetical protein